MFAELVNHLWQSTLFGVAIAAVTLLVRKDGAHVRYWLWWAASVKFLVPFAWLTAAGAALSGSVPAVVVLAEWPAALGKVAQPMTSGTPWTVAGIVLAGAWAAGFIAVAGSWIARARQVCQIVAAASPCSSFPRLGPAVKYAPARSEPAMVGIFRPVLLIPRGIEERLTHAQLAAVLEHELCHWRRRDNLTAAVHMLTEAVFWFHPLVWLIGARLWDERERACDEAVVAAGHGRAVYAEAILDVCELYVASPLRCASGVGGADLKRRVTDIVRSRVAARLHAAKRAAFAVAAGAVLTVPIAIGILSGAPAFAQDDRDHVPLVRIAPEYPPEALAAGLDGSVTLEFTITTDGRTADVVAVDSTSPLFEQAAVDALRRWRYAPVMRDDRPFELRGVQTIIRFELARDAEPAVRAGDGSDAALALRVGGQELLNLELGAYTPQERPLQAAAGAVDVSQN